MGNLDLLKDKVKPLYFRYLTAAFGSALTSSIYSIVDMAIVGQYQGPDGTAALAVVAPVWNIIYSFGLLAGIGGAGLFSPLRGSGKTRHEDENEYFTTALGLAVFFAALWWVVIAFFDVPMLRLFGASDSLLPLAQDYILPIKFVVPFFLFNQMLAAFLRNDGSPGLATAGVLAGGIFNIFGDWFFVFACDMGIFGAGLATAIGAAITFFVMLTHFFSRKCTLRLVRPKRVLLQIQQIIVTGFSTFFIDVAMGILTMLFNRQIMRYIGADGLSVYGIIVNVSTIVQCCAYSIGQAAQPIISRNLGAKEWTRIRQTLRYALYTAGFFSIFWTALTLAVPNGIVRVFMAPTESVLVAAPGILRSYCISFLLLPLNIFSTYYFQALMKPQAAFVVSVARGLIISGALIYALPALVAPGALWFAMPITELVVAVYVVIRMAQYARALGPSPSAGQPA